MVTICGMLQAPIQAMVRPSMWLPCFRKLHSHRQIWKIQSTQTEFARDVIEAVKSVMTQEDNTEFLDIHKVTENGLFIRVFAFTRAEWLDVVELTFSNGYIQANSFSSGVVPLVIPCAALCNMFCFFAPFLDMDFNEKRLNRIREAMTISVELVDENFYDKL